MKIPKGVKVRVGKRQYKDEIPEKVLEKFPEAKKAFEKKFKKSGSKPDGSKPPDEKK